MCIEIEKRYEIDFLEIGTAKDYVHFLVQSVHFFDNLLRCNTYMRLLFMEENI